MENTKINKEKFFAQYWGQKVLQTGSSLQNISQVWNLKHPNFYLQLKPLQSISDEDAIEVAKLLWSESKYHTVNDGRYYIKSLYDLNDDNDYEMGIQSALKIIDHLRSKGYALNWMHLSVEDLQNYGWIKLAE